MTLHQTLLEQGHACRLFVGSQQTAEPQVFQIEQKRTIPGLLRLTRRLERQGVQNLYAPWFRRLAKTIGDVDVVHLHSLWKSPVGFADLSGIRAIARRYPTVMTLREAWMMTGHCACPIGCERWKLGCGKCPDLQRAPSVQRDFTALNWRRKRQTIQRSDLHITAISSWLRSQIQQSPIFDGKPIHVVYNSVEAEHFRPGDQVSARAALGVPADKWVVLLAGQSIEGIHTGISQHGVEALNHLNDASIHPLLVGRSAAAVAATLQIPSTIVSYRETPAAMAQCFQAADLTVVPSEYETFGRVAAESLFCGTPVVAFATGGLSEVVVDGVCGRLVPTRNSEALARAVFELKADRQLLKQFRGRCVEHAQQRFSKDGIANQYLEVYRQAIEARKIPAVA